MFKSAAPNTPLHVHLRYLLFGYVTVPKYLLIENYRLGTLCFVFQALTWLCAMHVVLSTKAWLYIGEPEGEVYDLRAEVRHHPSGAQTGGTATPKLGEKWRSILVLVRVEDGWYHIDLCWINLSIVHAKFLISWAFE